VHFGSAVSERDTPENELQKANERVSANILKENSIGICNLCNFDDPVSTQSVSFKVP